MTKLSEVGRTIMGTIEFRSQGAVRRSEHTQREGDSKLSKNALVPSASRNSRELEQKMLLYL